MNEFLRGFQEELEKIAYSLAQVSKVVRKAKGVGRLPALTEAKSLSKLKPAERTIAESPTMATIGEATTMSSGGKRGTEEFVQDILFRKRLKELQRSRPLKKTALTMDPELAERLSAGEPALPPIPEYVQALPQMQMAQPVAPEPSVTPAKVKQVGGKLMGMAGQYLQGSQQPRVYESYNPPHITSGFRY